MTNPAASAPDLTTHPLTHLESRPIERQEARRVSRWLIMVFATLLITFQALQLPAVLGQDSTASGVSRVVAIGDVHGAFDALVSILRTAGLVSSDLHWVGGSSQLVFLGDLVDRGPRSRDVLDLARRLQGEANEAGGRVHVLLGNHEVMNLIGDLRYVSPEEYAAFANDESEEDRRQALDEWIEEGGRKGDRSTLAAEHKALRPRGFYAHRRAFASTGVYGRWLLEQRIMVVVNGVAYMHGGLAPCLADFAAETINDVAMSELREYVGGRETLIEAGIFPLDAGYPEQLRLAKRYYRRWQKVAMPRVKANVDAASSMLDNKGTLTLRNDGPLWYRGTSLNPAELETEVTQRILKHLGASRVVIGHTPTHTGRIDVRLDGTVVRVDTGMLTSHYHGAASAVVSEASGAMYALYPGEGIMALTPELEATASLDLDRATLEQVLATAEVMAVGEVGAGSTDPQRVIVGRNGQLWRAIFKTGDSPSAGGDSHRFRYEVAAYLLDEMLGFDLVPPAVLRRIGEREGSLQLWIEDAINERDRRGEQLTTDLPAFERQLELIPVFDVLINNPHREPTNILITTHDWKVYLIDHSGAFGPATVRPSQLADTQLQLDLDIVNRLLSLELESLSSRLDGVLDPAEIAALISRRDLILEPWRAENEPEHSSR